MLHVSAAAGGTCNMLVGVWIGIILSSKHSVWQQTAADLSKQQQTAAGSSRQQQTAAADSSKQQQTAADRCPNNTCYQPKALLVPWNMLVQN